MPIALEVVSSDAELLIQSVETNLNVSQQKSGLAPAKMPRQRQKPEERHGSAGMSDLMRPPPTPSPPSLSPLSFFPPSAVAHSPRQEVKQQYTAS